MFVKLSKGSGQVLQVPREVLERRGHDRSQMQSNPRRTILRVLSEGLSRTQIVFPACQPGSQRQDFGNLVFLSDLPEFLSLNW